MQHMFSTIAPIQKFPQKVQRNKVPPIPTYATAATDNVLKSISTFKSYERRDHVPQPKCTVTSLFS